jgi:hypothetical protein
VKRRNLIALLFSPTVRVGGGEGREEEIRVLGTAELLKVFSKVSPPPEDDSAYTNN